MPDESEKLSIGIGDVVYLMSGSYAMTIVALGDKIGCAWFDSAGECHADIFPPEALTRVKILVHPPDC